MFLLQNRWQLAHFVVLVLSISTYFIVSIIVSSVLIIDFEYYGVSILSMSFVAPAKTNQCNVLFCVQMWFRCLGSGTWWLALLLICYVVLSKDCYSTALVRAFSPEPYQILQEVCVVAFLRGVTPCCKADICVLCICD